MTEVIVDSENNVTLFKVKEPCGSQLHMGTMVGSKLFLSYSIFSTVLLQIHLLFCITKLKFLYNRKRSCNSL